ncbi:hypothetical protein DNL40_03520 [Xylanimonas oleitrophica]|uniref:Transglutaminase-like domain-containing protein n=1 Tax=Xylanimonas oleitrophica TaxID=2607479 RepID=A0A2W5X3B7_9MICO|nr:DUF3488 and transglutaminase-like domain-containing protein [Xylanimonas oleitrophica]PZR55436.1 hypothetical protein DNL40_03520 [Xylanimonas oleitrophica]
MIPATTSPTLRAAVSTGLVTLAVLASALGLTRVVLPGPWTGAAVAGILLVGAASATTRAVIGRRRARRTAAGSTSGRRHGAADDGGLGSVVPTLVAIAVAAWFLLARFGGPGSGAQWLVAPGSVSRLTARLGEAGSTVRDEIAPVVGTHSMGLVCVGGALVVLVVADALAAGLRHPLLAAVPVLVLWAPPLVLAGEVPWATFAVTVVALLLGLTLEPPGTRRRPGGRLDAHVRRAERHRAAATTATAAAVTAGALVVGTAATGLPAVQGSWTDVFTTSSRTVRLADDLDMYRSLTARSGEVVLRYTTSTQQDVGPLRVLTLSGFDGRSWGRGPAREGDGFAADQVLFPDDAPLTGETTRLDVTVGSMREPYLPLSLDPRTVETQDGWRYDPARDEIVGGPVTQEGDTYSLAVHERALSAEALRGSPTPTGTLDAVFLEVPDTAYAAEIRETAAQITAGATDPYDQAVALQSYLRDTTEFTYDVNVPRGSTGDAVYDFLQHRTGYCVQFATAMVVMSRTLGIPARLGVGYLPGRSGADGQWQVTGQDSHAWPELYFPGSGWVRFEPTPAVQTGAAPPYTTAPATTPGAQPTPDAEEREAQQPTAAASPTAPAPSPTAAPPTAQAPAGSAGSWVPAAALSALLLAAAGLLLWRRRRRAHAAPPDAEHAWQRVVAALAARGVVLPAAVTPRRAPGEIGSALSSRYGRTLDPDATTALVRLAEAVEAQRYAADAPFPEPEELASLVTAATAGIHAVASSRGVTGRDSDDGADGDSTGGTGSTGDAGGTGRSRPAPAGV